MPLNSELEPYHLTFWTSSGQNLSSGFLKNRDSNRSSELQRLARILKFCLKHKFRYATFQKANNKGADQTARMRRLVCACVVRKPLKTGFLASRPTLIVFLKVFIEKKRILKKSQETTTINNIGSINLWMIRLNQM